MNTQALSQLLQELAATPQKAELLAVTKYMEVDSINVGIKAGVTKIGENRVEVMEEKLPLLLPAEKHFIGTIQSKKLRKIFSLFDVIESIASREQAEKLSAIASESGKTAHIFLQIHIAKEEQKSGFLPETFLQELSCIATLPNLHIEGIMAMATNTENEDQIRSEFMQVKQLFDIAKIQVPSIQILSLGMSSDYKIALEVGATMVRIGSLLQ